MAKYNVLLLILWIKVMVALGLKQSVWYLYIKSFDHSVITPQPRMLMDSIYIGCIYIHTSSSTPSFESVGLAHAVAIYQDTSFHSDGWDIAALCLMLSCIGTR